MKHFVFFLVLFSSIVFKAQVPSYVPTSNLIGWWPFCGNANDVSGNSFHGTALGATLTTDRFGNTNNAYSLNGITNSIYINHSFFNPGWNEFTISGWYYLNVLTNTNNFNQNQTLFNTAPHNGLGISSNWGGVSKHGILAGSGTPASSWNILPNIPSTQTVTINTWKHFVLTKSGTNYSFYIDGVLDVTTTASSSVVSYLYKMYFGNTDPNIIYEGVLGKIDDYGIWNRKLTQLEITALYSGTSPCATSTPTINLTSDLIICMSLDGNATDFSGNSNHGVMTSITSATDRFGNINSAVKLNGINSKIVVPASSSINSVEASDELTITSWCKINAFPTNNCFPICNKYNSSSTWGWDYTIQTPVSWNGQIFVPDYFGMGGSYGICTGNEGVTTNQWDFYSITFSKTAGKFKVYKNAILLNTANTGLFELENTANGDLYIGCSPAHAMDFADGIMDDFKMYGRALTQSEITALYSGTSPCALATTSSFTTSTQTVCLGQSVSFTNTSVAATSYTWNFGDGNNSTLQNPSHTYSVTGTYTVNLISVGSNSATSSSTINVVPLPTLSIASTSAICLGESATLSGSGANSYTWTNHNTQSYSISVTPSITTTYSLIGSSSAGCVNYLTHTVVVSPLPVIAINGNTATCVGSAIMLSATGANSYTWANTGAQTSTISVVPLTTTIYSVTGTATTSCANSMTYTLVVNPTPTLSVIGSYSVCEGSSITLMANGASTYSWYPLGGNSSSVVISPTTTTVYTLTGTSNAGCLGTSMTYSVNVYPTPTFTIITTPTVCANSSFVLAANGASSYSISGIGGFTHSVTISPTASTNYSVIGISNMGCRITETIAIQVILSPNLTIDGDSIVCIGSGLILTANTTATNVLWNNSQITHTIYITPTANQYYSVIASNGFCSVKDSILIKHTSFINSDFTYSIEDTCKGLTHFMCIDDSSATTNFWQISNTTTFANTCLIKATLPYGQTQSVTHITNPNTSCADTTTLFINISSKLTETIFPNVITPNEDNKNDQVDFKNYLGCVDFDFEIFDRWGLSIMKSNNTQATIWDGRTTSGQKCVSGVYFYIIKTSTTSYKGTISLFR